MKSHQKRTARHRSLFADGDTRLNGKFVWVAGLRRASATIWTWRSGLSRLCVPWDPMPGSALSSARSTVGRTSATVARHRTAPPQVAWMGSKCAWETFTITFWIFLINSDWPCSNRTNLCRSYSFLHLWTLTTSFCSVVFSAAQKTYHWRPAEFSTLEFPLKIANR